MPLNLRDACRVTYNMTRTCRLQLVGIAIELQATDRGEVDVKEVLAKIGEGAKAK